MSDTVYTAILDSGSSTESIELEFIEGLPQKSLVRTADIDGEPAEVVWELDPDAAEYTYRPTEIQEGADAV
ncbi:hypothetical protein [Subtercola endophyticus]|uniref:hypothetical protein n=1 Tax=Subtercola endophyticus TaxID=2895559 RepID=UPI001E5FCF4E|nr:hypothetical protein [Subtercola endophyticus]UFS59709.1 hypothetical protein LQ955_02605 [Subtercola endophyticus]